MRAIVLLCIVANLALASARPLNGSQFRQVDDMIIRLDDIENFSNGSIALSRPSLVNLWKHGRVYYEIAPELLYSRRNRKMIEEAMREISDQTNCVKFVKRGDDGLDEDNYVKIQMGDNGCNSFVGMKVGMQELNLDYGCLDKGSIIHELMHVLGFFHEHCRPDRDDNLNIFLENVLETKKHNFDKFNWTQYPYDASRLSFDYESIMIYGEYAFTKNNAPTMLPKHWIFGPRITNPNQKTRLSRVDVMAVRLSYGCDSLNE